MIRLTNVSKSFGDLKAVKNISFSIKEGEIFGLLGPNGAGKSTTINMMSTLLKSDAGSVSIAGNEVQKNTVACKQLIGVVPQEISLYDDFSAYDNLLFWGSLYAVPKKELNRRIKEILDLIGLADRKNDLIKNYSGGMKRRINIAAAILHKPKVLFMDEPTVGVDPQSRNRIFDIVETLNKQGMTIVYTTHYMEEVERLCDRIAIMDLGKIIAQGTKEELQKQSNAKEHVVLKVNGKEKVLFDCLKQKYATVIEGKTLRVECNVNTDLARIVSFCNSEKIEIEDLKLNKVNLEAIFLNLTGKQLRDS